MSKFVPVYNVLVHNFNADTISYANWFDFGAWNVIEKRLKKVKKDIHKMFEKFHTTGGEYVYDAFLEDIKKYYAKQFVEFDEKLADNLGEGNVIRNLIHNILEHECMYYYWGKCEWEVVVKPWVGRDASLKIDVYTQLKQNWDSFESIVLRAICV